MCEEVVELVRVNEGLAVAFDAQFVLAGVEEVAEINVEEPSSILLEHEVRGVSISYPQDVSSYTLTCQRSHEAVLIRP